MNLHDWIDELCDVLDIDVEVDEALVLDLARDAAHNVERPAAPITTYLLGYAAALHGADLEQVERLAAAATELAQKWDAADPGTGPAGAEDIAALEGLEGMVDVAAVDEALVDTEID